MDSLVLLLIGLAPFTIVIFYLHVLSLKLDKLTMAVWDLEEKYKEKDETISS